MDHITAHEHELTTYAMQRLKEIPDIRIFGEAAHKSSVISFLVGNIHHFDMGTLLDRLGIAIRTGHHCAQPLMQRLGIEGTVRASFAVYNTKEAVSYTHLIMRWLPEYLLYLQSIRWISQRLIPIR